MEQKNKNICGICGKEITNETPMAILLNPNARKEKQKIVFGHSVCIENVKEKAGIRNLLKRVWSWIRAK